MYAILPIISAYPMYKKDIQEGHVGDLLLQDNVDIGYDANDHVSVQSTL